MESKRTKQCRALKNLFSFLHFLCLFGPLLFFIPYSFAMGTPVSKIALGLTTIVSLILGAFSLIADKTSVGGLHKSILWFCIIGVLFCLESVKGFIWIMAITSILDELIFVRLKNQYSAALISNKEIDRRS